MRSCFRGWREANKNEREGARRLEEIGGKRMKRVVVQYMRYLVRDKGVKMNNIEVAKEFNEGKAI
jgi:hypothetical protein